MTTTSSNILLDLKPSLEKTLGEIQNGDPVRAEELLVLALDDIAIGDERQLLSAAKILLAVWATERTYRLALGLWPRPSPKSTLESLTSSFTRSACRL